MPGKNYQARRRAKLAEGEDVQAEIDAEEKRWVELSVELQRNYQVQYGVYMGRISVMRERKAQQEAAREKLKAQQEAAQAAAASTPPEAKKARSSKRIKPTGTPAPAQDKPAHAEA